jgi:predicted dehydrogenase
MTSSERHSPANRPGSGCQPLKAAVVGVGYFGAFHAEKYAAHDGAELVSVVDIEPTRAKRVAETHGIAAFTDYREIIDAVDVVSVVTPAMDHHEVAQAFLANGVHVLVEKPITLTVADASNLVRIAAERDLVLQVGHQERFFTSQFDLATLVDGPSRIECWRSGPYTGRNTDCSVVTDLMIHDIHLVRSLIALRIEGVSGQSAALVNSLADEADVTLRCADGCRIDLRASRVSDERRRMVRIVQSDGVIEIDFLARRCRHSRLGEVAREGAIGGGGNGMADDDLGCEIAAFLAAVRDGSAPIVGGEQGLEALETALLIESAIEANFRPDAIR